MIITYQEVAAKEWMILHHVSWSVTGVEQELTNLTVEGGRHVDSRTAIRFPSETSFDGSGKLWDEVGGPLRYGLSRPKGWQYHRIERSAERGGRQTAGGGSIPLHELSAHRRLLCAWHPRDRTSRADHTHREFERWFLTSPALPTGRSGPVQSTQGCQLAFREYRKYQSMPARVE